MPFNSANDSIDILIRAKAEGQAAIKGLDDATKGLNTTATQNIDILKRLDATNTNLIKSIDALTTTVASNKKAFKESSNELDDFTKRLQSIISNPAYSINSPFTLLGRGAQQFAQSLGPLGVGLSATAVGLGIVVGSAISLVNEMGQGARELQNFALRLDLSVATAQRLSFAAQIAGVNISTLEQSARMLSSALDDPGGSGKKQIAVLEKIGIATRDVSGTQREMRDVLTDVLDHLSGMTNSAQRAHDAQVLLGRGSKELIPLLADYKEAKELADKFAASLDQNVNQRLLEGKRAISELDIAWEVAKKNLAAAVEPIVIPVIGFVTSVLQGGTDPHQIPENPTDAQRSLLTRGHPSVASLRAGDNKQLLGDLSGGISSLSAVNSFDAQKGKTIEGLQEVITKAKETQKELDAAIHGGEGADAIKTDSAKYRKQDAIIANAQARIKELEKLKNMAEEVQRALDSFLKSSNTKEAETPFDKEYARYENLLSGDFGKYATTAQKNAAFDASMAVQKELLNKELEKEAKNWEKLHKETETYLNKRFNEGFTDQIQPGLNKVSKDAFSVLDESVKTRDIAGGSQVEALKQKSERAQKLNELTYGSAGQEAAINDAYRERLTLAQQILKVRLDDATYAEGIASAEQDRVKYVKASQDALKAQDDYQKEIDDAKYNRQVAYLELQKKELDQYKEGAGKIFDALTAKGGGGLTDLFGAELKTIERQLFVNASGLTYSGFQSLGVGNLIGGQTGTDGKPSMIGKLLAGTPFASKGTNSVEDYTRRTAVATEKIASGVTTTAGGLPGLTVTSGIPGLDSLPAIGGSATSLINFANTGIGGSSSTSSPIAKIFGGAASTGVSSFLGAAALGATGGYSLSDIVGGFHATGPTTPGGFTPGTNLTTAQQVGAGIGAAGTVFTGVENAYHAFKQGGVGGISGGIASIAGTAAALDPEPISKAVLSGVALVSGIVGVIFGNSKQKRADQISKYITNNQDVLPQAIQRDVDISGANVIYGANGATRTGGATVVNNYTTVHAMDAESFQQFTQKHSSTLATAVQTAMNFDHPINNAISQRFAN